jgi:hypothetical protein
MKHVVLLFGLHTDLEPGQPFYHHLQHLYSGCFGCISLVSGDVSPTTRPTPILAFSRANIPCRKCS